MQIKACFFTCRMSKQVKFYNSLLSLNFLFSKKGDMVALIFLKNTNKLLSITVCLFNNERNLCHVPILRFFLLTKFVHYFCYYIHRSTILNRIHVVILINHSKNSIHSLYYVNKYNYTPIILSYTPSACLAK